MLEDLFPWLADFSPTLADFSPMLEDLFPWLADFSPTLADFSPTLAKFLFSAKMYLVAKFLAWNRSIIVERKPAIKEVCTFRLQPSQYNTHCTTNSTIALQSSHSTGQEITHPKPYITLALLYR